MYRIDSDHTNTFDLICTKEEFSIIIFNFIISASLSFESNETFSEQDKYSVYQPIEITNTCKRKK